MKIGWKGKTQKVSKAEFELLVVELTERIKDMVYMRAEEQVRKKLSEIGYMTADDALSFSYEVEMVGGDILQVIGRKRRLSDKVENNPKP